MQTGDIVRFRENEHTVSTGHITRVWDKPAADPYVTIVTDHDGRPATFVRCSSRVIPVGGDRVSGVATCGTTWTNGDGGTSTCALAAGHQPGGGGTPMHEDADGQNFHFGPATPPPAEPAPGMSDLITRAKALATAHGTDGTISALIELGSSQALDMRDGRLPRDGAYAAAFGHAQSIISELVRVIEAQA